MSDVMAAPSSKLVTGILVVSKISSFMHEFDIFNKTWPGGSNLKLVGPKRVWY